MRSITVFVFFVELFT